MTYQVSSRVERLRHARDVDRLRELDGYEPPGGEATAPALAFLPMYQVAHRQHVPLGRLHGVDVVLYRASRGDGSGADEPYIDIYSDSLLGWEPRVEGAIEAIDVPGGHSSLLQEPHVGALAKAMQMRLERVWLARPADPVPSEARARTTETLATVD